MNVNTNIDYTEIGRKIHHSRMEHSYTQEQLTELCDISTAFVGHIERGTRAMSLETLVTVCKILNLSADYLLMDELPETDASITAAVNQVKAKGNTQYQKFLLIIKALAMVSDDL
ncbi:MAG: helix-turn-helix domain-containing protein [Lachnospiraceae bacterium]|nr:helix-turn-helix domain-containing protein [Lachnospiraceae bacterium]